MDKKSAVKEVPSEIENETRVRVHFPREIGIE
jgi:hypothetical protein